MGHFLCAVHSSNGPRAVVTTERVGCEVRHVCLPGFVLNLDTIGNVE